MEQKSVLIVEASARQDGSLSRMLASRFEHYWKQGRPHDAVVHRDVGKAPPAAINETWLAAAFTPAEHRSAEQERQLSLSDVLIAEVRDADIIVISTPMYNYGMPAALKAWVDQVVRINETFDFDLARGDFPLRPTLNGKCLVALTACGEFGFEQGGINEGSGHLVPHLQTVSKYLGVEQFIHVGIEFQEFKDARHDASIRHAVEMLERNVERLMQSLNACVQP
ncbi:FMN-dependent NADH-azoreductase [Henriciella pelagia]|uniref:FMN dependent NADH:quinone oxidoreductase n=1 Tax=Henriciella pelagia TaxID=1977912 RepID=A0ABQ1IZG7_9PROT|nr:NAD(P)H-dependent oxidoreductase [Henriciella pelagia]GGB56256.1 FMN-dependent NADH-azoreductase [Henriciella pelagia]